MDSSWGPAIAAILGSGVITAVVNGVSNRRKLGAEASREEAQADQLSAQATQTITTAASGVVADVRADNQRLRMRADRQDERIEELEDWIREWRDVLQVHAAWDAMAITKVREAIPPIELPSAPPLSPPNRRRPGHRFEDNPHADPTMP